ncbi:MAG TPA: AAA family ATPase [Syntrophobacter fumaroxidans]|mgnify:CR=1 FL=1|nr:AAA family ATPase [Syntrophobacter fumaroxidans]
MLTALRIGNFKAFAESQRIPVRPLTLIYGANSSGKSSVLHSLVLARHAQETGDLDVHRTNVGGESVDLGGFRQYVHRREANRRVEWAVDLDTSSFRDRLAELFAPVKQVTMLLNLGIGLDDQDHPLPESIPEIHTCELLADGRSLLRMSRRRDGKLQLDRLDHEHPVFREVIKAMVLLSTTTETIHPEDFEGLDEAIGELVPEIVAKSTQFLPDGLAESSVYSPGGQPRLFTISKARRKEELSAAVRSFLPRKVDEILRGVSQVVTGELSRLRYLGPLRSYPLRHLAFSQHHDPNWFAGGGYAWDVIRRDANVRKLVNEWLSAPNRLQTPYELMVRDLVGIDQLEGPLLDGLERLNDEGLDLEHEMPSERTVGGAWPVIRDPEMEAVRLRELIRTSDLEKLNELIMIDRRSNTFVSHRDVGIGVSQVLPVLVSAYAARNRIVAVEQPEIHLHPALQADLGDVFIQSALGAGRNRFLIETHSEHLLLRVMRRMRETSNGELPEGIPPITPGDVCVLFVQPKGTSSAVRHLELDEEGQLLDAWPGGFFEEGYRERFA